MINNTNTNTTKTTIFSEDNYRIEPIEVDKISDELYDFRDKQKELEDKTSEEFQQLKLSIENEGILSPVHISRHKQKADTYLLVDGRRRFNAIKELGIKTIPAIIVSRKAESDLDVITLVQNIHRKDLKAEEKTKAILKLFELHGYGYGEVMQITNKLDYSKRKDSAAQDVNSKYINTSIKSEREKTFDKLVKRIGIHPRYIRTLVYVYSNLDKEVYEEIEKAELPLYYQSLLVNKTLKQHPEIAKGLVWQLKSLKNYEDAKTWRDQQVSDLETGALKVDEDVPAYGYQSDPSKREDVTRPKTVPSSVRYYLEMIRRSNEFLDTFTDDAKSKSKNQYNRIPADYTKEHIKYSEDFRRQIIDD